MRKQEMSADFLNIQLLVNKPRILRQAFTKQDGEKINFHSLEHKSIKTTEIYAHLNDKHL